ncbi:hypothetical protein BDFB_008515, partial [Asbolus verrucosus]
KVGAGVGVEVISGCDCGGCVCFRHECGGPGEIAPFHCRTVGSQKLCGDRVHGNSHTKRGQAIQTATVLPTASFTRTPLYYRLSFAFEKTKR